MCAPLKWYEMKWDKTAIARTFVLYQRWRITHSEPRSSWPSSTGGTSSCCLRSSRTWRRRAPPSRRTARRTARECGRATPAPDYKRGGDGRKQPSAGEDALRGKWRRLAGFCRTAPPRLPVRECVLFLILCLIRVF